MPGYNRTGPMGQGMTTGRGIGVCNTFPDAFCAPYTRDIGSGRGMKMRRRDQFCRQGFGLGRRFSGDQVLESETVPEDVALKMDMLKTKANAVKQTLDQIYDQIKDLEKTKET
ncbi:MAG: DUF5320 domain-containing protein [Deltaproteobacteria bacterium]|uniref:DUF5320 domain-containing protein n=1 Tax=Desulfobacula sp. TaxID=2593537 RepID=UPI0019C329D3|nr:DUF5320 domain-containing protein [Candidatus Desulfobacula maris]MBL6993685.1 DUF5320 domain-containing protein [Desulfobacula sp.]